MSLSSFILQKLLLIESSAEFSGRYPKITSSSGKNYFVKVGSPREEEQYIGEALSLKKIYEHAPGLAPQVLDYGRTEEGKPYFISEYRNLGGMSDAAAKVLGRRLATELHTSRGMKQYGFEVPTYCGATRMRNGFFDTWEEQFSVMIGDLLQSLETQGGYSQLCKKGERVRTDVIPKLVGSLNISPALCHGDLWSGNISQDASSGEPVIFDPSSLYGHNEFDLAITRMFGGVPHSFFEEYHKHRPKTEPKERYDLRQELYQLFHYLNHTALFGGGYAGSALRRMDLLLREKF